MGLQSPRMVAEEHSSRPRSILEYWLAIQSLYTGWSTAESWEGARADGHDFPCSRTSGTPEKCD
jgi:hypothetical protein